MRFLILLPLLAGFISVFQGGINSALGKRTGLFEASLMNFIVGAAVLIVITLFFGKGNFFEFSSAPKWQLIGLLGATYIAVVVLMVPQIGLSTFLITIIVGLVLSAVIDNFGLFGGSAISFNWQRLLGILLMGVAVFLFYYKKV